MLHATVATSESIGLGTWPDWVAAIGTSLAFLIAALAYAADARLRTRSQARLVYAKIVDIDHRSGETATIRRSPGASVLGGDIPSTFTANRYGHLTQITATPHARLTVEVHNGSQELIGPTTLRALNQGTGEVWDFQLNVGFVEPGSKQIANLYCSNPQHPGQPSLGVIVLFRDSTGRWWKRVGHAPVERIHDDPENDGVGPVERALARSGAELMGATPAPEYVPSLRVRVSRRLRRLRGKAPIP